jgi:hypothetical protein
MDDESERDAETDRALGEIEAMLRRGTAEDGESLARILFCEATRRVEGDEPPPFGTNPEHVFDEFERLAGRLGYRIELRRGGL